MRDAIKDDRFGVGVRVYAYDSIWPDKFTITPACHFKARMLE